MGIAAAPGCHATDRYQYQLSYRAPGQPRNSRAAPGHHPREEGGTLSLSAFIGLITIAPLVVGLIIIVLGAVRLATWRVVLALGILGALIPAIGLPFLVPTVAYGDPLVVQPFGMGSDFGAWVVPTFRLDALGLYMAMGVAFVVTPLLLWMAFADRAAEMAEDLADEPEPDVDDAGKAAAEPGDVTADKADGQLSQLWALLGGKQGFAAPALTRAVACTLALEVLALSAALADSVVLLGVSWALLALAAWAIGESASERTQLDLPGLGLMVAGPVLWLIIVLFPATGAHTPRLFSLTGATAFNAAHCILLAVAIALAGGAYPFTAWLRRRASLATPAGIAAMVVALVPAALYVALRTYGAAADDANQWPLFGSAPTGAVSPAPVTAGIAFAVLGAATVAISGFLALARRDGRTLVCLAAAAQLGWGLVGVGIGRPISALGVVILLPAMVLGLGAMLATLVASGVITSDLEPDADGPRPAGAPLRLLAIGAWSLGALSLIGMPLLAGFAPRHLMDVGAVQINGLGIPLLGLCWVGDALLALALLRAVAPALSTSTPELASSGAAFTPSDIPAAILALFALAIGVFPALLTGVFGNVAAAAVLGPRATTTLLTSTPLGYTTGSAQWLGAIAWLVVLVMGVGLAIIRSTLPRAASPVFVAGQSAAGAAESGEEGVSAAMDADDAVSVATSETGDLSGASLAAPADAWSDLQRAFASPWMLPAGGWLLAGTDDDSDTEGDDGEFADEQEELAGEDADDENTDASDGVGISAKRPQKGQASTDDE